jgi:hypothetical protein
MLHVCGDGAVTAFITAQFDARCASRGAVRRQVLLGLAPGELSVALSPPNIVVDGSHPSSTLTKAVLRPLAVECHCQPCFPPRRRRACPTYTLDGNALSRTILPCARRRYAVKHRVTGCSAATSRRARHTEPPHDAVEHRLDRVFSGCESSSTSERRLFRRGAVEHSVYRCSTAGSRQAPDSRVFSGVWASSMARSPHFPALGRQA